MPASVFDFEAIRDRLDQLGERQSFLRPAGPARVLVVDDVEANVQFLTMMLEREYYLVSAACDGFQALAQIETEKPDIVLLDIMMPGMDGFEVCRRIRTNPASAHIPVIFVTGLSDEASRLRGFEAGADDYFICPVNVVALMARIRALLQQQRTGTWMEANVLSRNLEKSLHRALACANERRHEYATLEHLLLSLTEDQDAVAVLRACGVEIERLRREVLNYVDDELANLVAAHSDDAKPTASFQRVLQRAAIHVQSSRHEEITGANVLIAMFAERESHAVNFLEKQDITRFDAVNFISHGIAKAPGRSETRRAQKGEEDNQGAGARLPFRIGRQMLVIDETKIIAAILCGQMIVKDTETDHQAGDRVLKQVVGRVTSALRPSDLVARTGGDEFVVLTSETGVDAALQVAERLRRRVGDTSVEGATVTVSIGVAVSRSDLEEEMEATLQRASAALYEAKRAGGNRVVVDRSGEPPHTPLEKC